MHSSYPAYNAHHSYGMTATGMPTQSAYPPTYNPYSGGAGSAGAYMGSSGTPGSALYHQNTRFSPPAYTSNPNMLNYMSSYPSADCRQVSMPYSASTLAYNTPPPSSTTSGTTSMYSDTPKMQDLVSSVLTDTSSAALGLTVSAAQTSATAIASAGEMGTSNVEMTVTDPRSASSSPKESSGTPGALAVAMGADTTTQMDTPTTPPSAEQEGEQTGSPKEEKAEVQRFYSSRYV